MLSRFNFIDVLDSTKPRYDKNTRLLENRYASTNTESRMKVAGSTKCKGDCSTPGVRILTDIRIDQSPNWMNQTTHFSCDRGIALRFLSLIRKMRDYDVFVSADLKLAQLYGLYRAVFRNQQKKHIILELMLDEEQDNLKWRSKNFVQRFCFSSVDCIFVSSTLEIPTYSRRLGLPEERLQFLPFHTNIIHPEMCDAEGDFILAAGRTGRDYATLAKAVEGLEIKVVVVCDRHSAQTIKFPENVELFCEIPPERYMELLRSSSLVVVPLQKLIKSTGQVVFLEAMGLGKPVISTETIGTTDYIEHEVTGTLVPPEDPVALRCAIVSFVENSDQYRKMAVTALNQVRERHTFEAYTGRILNEAGRLVERNGRST